MWHRVAPQLAERFAVVATDLRGYGDSRTPPSAPDHAPYSMREIARDQVEVMQSLGHDRFGAVGHDRGARCAYRLALDLPDAVARLAVLDIVPTADTFAQADPDFARAFWVWLFLSSEEPVPEELIAHCAGRLAAFKCPRRVRVVAALPRSATGKILKSALRETLSDLAPRCTP